MAVRPARGARLRPRNHPRPIFGALGSHGAVHKPHKARQASLERKVVQKKTDNVAKYYGHFMSMVKQAEDMFMTDQITWFIDGLHPDLITTCAVQPNGQPWQNVTDLAHFALGEDACMKAMRTASHRASIARNERSQRQAPQDRQGGAPPPPSGADKTQAPSGPAKRPLDRTQVPPAKKTFKAVLQGTSNTLALPLDRFGPPQAPNVRYQTC